MASSWEIGVLVLNDQRLTMGFGDQMVKAYHEARQQRLVQEAEQKLLRQTLQTPEDLAAAERAKQKALRAEERLKDKYSVSNGNDLDRPSRRQRRC